MLNIERKNYKLTVLNIAENPVFPDPVTPYPGVVADKAPPVEPWVIAAVDILIHPKQYYSALRGVELAELLTRPCRIL
jgi:hypothetical protein